MNDESGASSVSAFRIQHSALRSMLEEMLNAE
jgi:hypothetical protein